MPTLMSPPIGATPAAAAADTPGKAPQPRDGVLEELAPLRLDQAARPRFDAGVQQSIRPKAEIRGSQIGQCPHEEPGADQQENGQRRLRRHHRLTAGEAEARQSGARVLLDHRDEIETGGPERRQGAEEQSGQRASEPRRTRAAGRPASTRDPSVRSAPNSVGMN